MKEVRNILRILTGNLLVRDLGINRCHYGELDIFGSRYGLIESSFVWCEGKVIFISRVYIQMIASSKIRKLALTYILISDL